MPNLLSDFSVTRIDGTPTSLGAFRGKVALIVNVASQCGLTPQYEALEALYAAHRDRGFEILAFPSNDFGGQEPGTHDEILEFCETKYNVSFPLFEKVSVTGDTKHPLYAELIAAQPNAIVPDGSELRDKLMVFSGQTTEEPEVLWNFEKFLVGRDGTIVARFAPDTTPDAAHLVAAIDSALSNA